MKTHFFLVLTFAFGLAFTVVGASLKPPEATEAALAESLCAMGCHVDMTMADGKMCVESVSAGGTALTKSVVAEPLSEPLFLQLKKLSCLRKLFLNYGNSVRLGPAATRNIAALQGLRELELHGTAVNDEIMPYVCSLTNLESLTLWDVSIGDPGIARLPGLKSLRSVRLCTHDMLSQRSVEIIAKLPELDYLQIAGDVEEGTFSALKSATNLKTLAVGGPRGVRALAELHGASTIQALEITRAEVDAAVAELLQSITNLSSLKLECCGVSPEAVKILSSLHLHQIECVQLRNDVLGGLAKGMQEGYGNLNIVH